MLSKELGEKRFVGFTCRGFGPCSAKVEKELRMAGVNNKNAISTLLLFLLALITTFQQDYYNNQPVERQTKWSAFIACMISH